MILQAEHAGQSLVAHADRRAAAAGVRAGMSVGHARALIGERPTLVLPHEPALDADALDALAQWALRFAPRVAVDPPAGLFMDATGCRRLFRGYRRLAQRLADALDRLGIEHRIAMASTFGGAWALARFARRTPALIGRDRLLEALRPLPPAALRLDHDTLAALAELGIDRIEHLLALPRAELTERFGPTLALRLDQATGEAIESLDPIRLVDPPRVGFEFDGPAKQLDAVVVIARRLLEELCERLAGRESGAARFALTLEHADHRRQRFDLTLRRPSREVDHLWSLLRLKLEAVDLGEGVDRMALKAERLERLAHHQRRAWWGGAEGGAEAGWESARAFGRLLDVLAGRLGHDRLWRIGGRASHLPWRAFELTPALSGDGSGARSGSGRGPRVERRGWEGFERAWGMPGGDQPSVVFARPEGVEVIASTPDGPPRWVRWRGSAYGVRRALGPQRLTPEWWRGGVASAVGPGEGGSPGVGGEGAGEAGVEGGVGGREVEGGASRAMVAAVHRDYFKWLFGVFRWVWVYRAVIGGRPSRWFLHGWWA